jgi:holdfast attachment protein HfaA
MFLPPIFKPALTTAVLAASVLVAGAASAQSMSSNSASYNAGYGRTSGSENQAVNPYTRDANGNRVIIDGVIQTGSDQSSFARSDYSGVSDSVSGAQTGNASAIGNNLTVITQGNYNTVIVDSTQINNGNVSAGVGDPNGQ